MTSNRLIALAAVALAAAIGGAIQAHAEPQPAFDRALVERLVRAQEQQAEQLRELVHATDRCRR